MAPQESKVPPFCPETGIRHSEIFAAASSGQKFCGYCAIPIPDNLRRSRTPALPGPDDSVIDLDSSPIEPRRSPASQLMRNRPKSPVADLKKTQLLPNSRDILANVPGTRANVRLLPPPDNQKLKPNFRTVAHLANEAIESQKKGGGRKSSTRSNYVFVNVVVLLVIRERILVQDQFHIDTIQSLKELGETSVKFTYGDLTDWDRFEEILVKSITRDPTINRIAPTDRALWTPSWASGTNGKNKITQVSSDYATPSQFIASGHFSNNIQGMKKMFYVLTSTTIETIEEDQEPFADTPTPGQNKKRKIKKESSSPIKKKAKQEACVKQEKPVKKELVIEESAQPAPISVSSLSADINDLLPSSSDLSSLEDLLSCGIDDDLLIQEGVDEEGEEDGEDEEGNIEQ